MTSNTTQIEQTHGRSPGALHNGLISEVSMLGIIWRYFISAVAFKLSYNHQLNTVKVFADKNAINSFWSCFRILKLLINPMQFQTLLSTTYFLFVNLCNDDDRGRKIGNRKYCMKFHWIFKQIKNSKTTPEGANWQICVFITPKVQFPMSLLERCIYV